MQQSPVKPLQVSKLTPEEELIILQKFETFVANYQVTPAPKPKRRQQLATLKPAATRLVA